MPLAEYNDVTRMTRAQLAERIRQMEATAARNSQLGAPGDRHRPMEDRRRREKIALYRAELDRRIQWDTDEKNAQASAPIAEPPTPHQRTAADLQAFTAKLKAEADARVCAWCEGTGTVFTNGDSMTARRCTACFGTGKDAGASQPPEPECLCRLDGDKADATDCPLHNPQPGDAMYRDTPVNYDATHQTRADDLERRQREADAAERQAEQAGPPAVPPPALRIACPRCHAAPGETCHNYAGYPMSPHADRKRAAVPAIPEPRTPDARAAKHVTLADPSRTAQDATATRRATVRTIRQTTPRPAPPGTGPHPGTPEKDGLSDLDRAVEALVREHTSHAVIDAAWNAAHRIFKPVNR